MTKNSLIAHTKSVQSYSSPALEVVSVVVESGYQTSNNQEPSPWEDMFYLYRY